MSTADSPTGPSDELRCQWCGVVSTATGATHCASCGAALILRESIGGMVIPGVTDVDPDLKVYANKPLRIPRGSPSHYVAGHAIGAAAADPTGMLAFGALAAVAAKELAGASLGRSEEQDPDKVGVPSAPVLDMVERLNRESVAEREATSAEETPEDPAAGRD